jgi:hypothetical protein
MGIGRSPNSGLGPYKSFFAWGQLLSCTMYAVVNPINHPNFIPTLSKVVMIDIISVKSGLFPNFINLYGEC